MMKNLEIEKKTRLLSDNYIGHLAYIANGSPHIVPITYYHDQKNNAIISYSSEGHKIDAMRINNLVSMEVEEIESMDNWKSILVHGKYEELHGSDAKFYLHEFTKGVKKNIEEKDKKDVEFISDFSSKIYSKEIPIVYRINILEITGKGREY